MSPTQMNTPTGSGPTPADTSNRLTGILSVQPTEVQLLPALSTSSHASAIDDVEIITDEYMSFEDVRTETLHRSG